MTDMSAERLQIYPKGNVSAMGTDTIRKLLPAAVLAVFVVISCLYINAPLKTPGSVYRSSELKKVETKDGNVTRTGYIDDDGNPQTAADAGYATRLTVHRKHSETEKYFDDQGKRMKRYSAYYGILREYDEAGNNYRVTYLDEEDAPVVTPFGYAAEERVFNESGQQISCRYLNAEGEPALSHDNGFGASYEYDDKGHRVRTTCLNAAGEPMILSSGYSTLVREYYETDGPENGKIKREFYFLPDGTPASLSLGQYGIYNEYDQNGLVSFTTYLDADGAAMVTNKGYTSAAYTYYADNSVRTTLYYDISGKPFRMSEGQYGIKNENGRTVYLNADGTEQFNIRNYVYNHSGSVIIIAIALVMLSALTGRKPNMLMLVIYIGVILYFTLMHREPGASRVGVLYSYRRFFSDAEARASIIKNVWLFIPLGTILFRLYPRKAILFAPVLLSAAIETVQFVTGMGFCELDDVISNGMGGAFGYGMGRLGQMIRMHFCSEKILSFTRKIPD